MVRNKAYGDEYYLIENRQQKGWDTKLPGRGMLILYVDYDRAIWENNLVNTMMSASNPDGFPSNDHQRCTPFHADNDPRSYYQGGVAYPYMENDSLTNTSHPAATLYHKNSDGSKLMNVGIMDITRNDDETMSFRFRNTPSEVYIPEGTVFRETFDRCNGNGGNDSIWNTTIASSNFQPDNEGWEVTKAFGGFQCARFGTLLTAGQGKTPSFTTETGEAVLTFKAAGWDKDGTTLTIGVEGEGTVKPSSVTMEPFAWNEYSLRVIGKGPLRLVFSPEKRFLLDEILVVQVKSELPDAIQQTTYSYQKQSGFYTLDGRYVGSSLDLLPRGIYVEVGSDSQANRKIIK